MTGFYNIILALTLRLIQRTANRYPCNLSSISNALKVSLKSRLFPRKQNTEIKLHYRIVNELRIENLGNKL